MSTKDGDTDGLFRLHAIVNEGESVQVHQRLSSLRQTGFRLNYFWPYSRKRMREPSNFGVTMWKRGSQNTSWVFRPHRRREQKFLFWSGVRSSLTKALTPFHESQALLGPLSKHHNAVASLSCPTLLQSGKPWNFSTSVDQHSEDDDSMPKIGPCLHDESIIL